MKKILSIMLAFALLSTMALGCVAEGFTATAKGFGGDVTATVTVEDGKVTAVEIKADADTPAIGGAAATKIAEAVLAAGGVEGVEAVAGATITSDAAIKAVTDALVAGEEVSLLGFGTFKVTERAARSGRNPATGETIQIAASKSVSFKAGKALKDKVN